MSRSRMSIVSLVLLSLLVPSTRAQTLPRPRYAGRPLGDVLRDLQAGGLKIVFSSELVRPDMMVRAEPRGNSPRKMLEAMLKPHGLDIQDGPGGTLLIVKRRRVPVRLATAPPALTGRVTGTVVDTATGSPISGVIVADQDREIETTTDEHGRFLLESVPAIRLQLIFSVVGYGLVRRAVDVEADQTLDVTIPLSGGTNTYTEQVTVTGDRFRGDRDTSPSRQILTSSEIQALRGTLTDDPFRAVQALPGVAATNDFRSEFSVRGSDFRHVGLSIDGLPTNWLLHNVRNREDNGSIAILNGDVIDAISLAAGAAPHDRPGLTGAWADFGLREGSRAALQVRGAVSATNASLVLEGPLGRSKHGSWLVSTRQSYLQWLLTQIDAGGTAFGFTDAEAKLVYDVTPRQQVTLTTVIGRTHMQQSTSNAGPNTPSDSVGSLGLFAAAWRSTIGSSLVATERVALQRQSFHNDAVFGYALGDGSASVVSYDGKIAWMPHSALGVQSGVLVRVERDAETALRYLETPIGTFAGPRLEPVNGVASTTTAYGRVTWTPTGRMSPMSIDTGAQIEHTTLTGSTMASPWVIGAWPITDRLTIRGGVSLSHQMPDFAQVVGPFGHSDAAPERARSVDVAAEYRASPETRLQVLVYNRAERHAFRLENSEPRLADGQLSFPSLLMPSWQNALNGAAHGIELLMQRRATGGVSGWLAYEYGRFRQTDVLKHETFWGDFDQRHSFSAYIEQRLSPKTSLSAKIRYGSNFPLAGYFDDRAQGLFVGGSRNTVRLPAYGRIDLRAEHAFSSNGRRLTLFLDMVNLLNRGNYARSGNSRFLPSGEVLGLTQKLFPLLPSAGLLVEF